MKKPIELAVCLGLALAMSGCRGSEPAKSEAAAEEKPGNWEPEKALVDRLQPYQDVEGYQLRLPKGYSLMQRPATPLPGVKVFYWMGPRQADGGGPSLAISVWTLAPGGEEPKDAVSKALAALEASPNTQDRPWERASVESGQIAGLPCLRGQSQVVTAAGAKVRSFAYFVKDGTTQIAIGGGASEADADALKLAEAAVLTFRKR
jgi:hypothetical protein